jgi:hypothetical protein
MNLVVLLMIGWAIVRRTIVKPHLIPWNLDAGLILGGIGSLMVTHFLYHGYHVAGHIAATGEAAPWYMPVSSFVATAFGPLSAEAAERGIQFGYWLHVLIILRSSTTCPTRSTSTCWAPCPTSRPATCRRACSTCPRSTSRTRPRRVGSSSCRGRA